MEIIRRGPPNPGYVVACSCEKPRFSTNISHYLGNDTRCGLSYRGTPMQSIEWCHFQWPRVTPLTQISRHAIWRWISQERYHIVYWSWVTARFSTTQSVARPLCDSWVALFLYRNILRRTCWKQVQVVKLTAHEHGVAEKDTFWTGQICIRQQMEK